MVSDPVCRTVVKSALEARTSGRLVQEVLNDDPDPTGELQRFSSQVLMAPTKVQGEDSSCEQAVQDLILYLWRRRLTQERAGLGEDQAARRSQLTYDLKALRRWEDGEAIIEMALGL